MVDEGISAIQERPDSETLEILIYGQRYSQVKSALYWISSLRNHIINWNEALVNKMARVDLGTEKVLVGTQEFQVKLLKDGTPVYDTKEIYEDVPIDPIMRAYNMVTKNPQSIIRAQYLDEDDIDEKTPPEKILAGIVNQIHRNYKALAKLDEIEFNVKMWGRIAGVDRYATRMMKETENFTKDYSDATTMLNLPPINFDSVKKSRDQTQTYEQIMRRFEENLYGL